MIDLKIAFEYKKLIILEKEYIIKDKREVCMNKMIHSNFIIIMIFIIIITRERAKDRERERERERER